MKGYTVFNGEQIDGLPGHFYAVQQPLGNAIERLEFAERFFANTKIAIQRGGNRAFYSVDRDIVQMPEFQTFRNGESYYATLAHECCHATRHPARLDRDLGRKKYADAGYAMEELVADRRGVPVLRSRHYSRKP
jgi:antirestriction protein ArdC